MIKLFKVVYLLIFGFIFCYFSFIVFGFILSIGIVIAVYTGVVIIPLHLILSMFNINLLNGVYKVINKLYCPVERLYKKFKDYFWNKVTDILDD